MLGKKSVEVEIGGQIIRFETGLLAKQAQGSICITVGETVLLSATTISKKPRAGITWFPLQVEYREKFYAAGRFPGGYFKREARPGEYEILTARVTDRPIRPLFPKGFNNDVQIFNQLLSTDGEVPTDILSINASSASLTLSEAPFMGPIGAVRIGRKDGTFIINPNHDEMAASDLNLTYVGSRELPLMIEGDAKEISEEDMLAAMRLAHGEVVKIIEAQLALRREMGLPDKTIKEGEDNKELLAKVEELIGEDLSRSMEIADKAAREEQVATLQNKVMETLGAGNEDAPSSALLEELFDTVEINTVRRNVLEKNQRIDGRAFDEIRPLSGSVGVLPRTHGSAVFTRGETQALATVTLGTLSDSQSMDAIAGGPDDKKFMLHYNFPPFSVGEAGRIMGPGRREIGHGNLAERSIRQAMPEDYAYTVRLVSEILESNGSSSMASICAGTLALMDAGVPMTKPVAGISIGLFTDDNGRSALVTDILGSEDHCGDMDFKVGGTRDGITGFQVDLKLRGLAWELVESAFEQARQARHHILDAMEQILEAPRDDISEYAPRIETLNINPEKIGALIGPGGKNIRRITETYDVQIDVEDDGTVHIFGKNRDSMGGALEEVNGLTAEAEIGKIYQGTVKGIKDFGCFVEILPGKEGLVHISELADFRVRTVEDICKLGDSMWVKCLDVDETGRIRLSRKSALAEKEGGDENGGESGEKSGSPREDSDGPGGAGDQRNSEDRRDRRGDHRTRR